MIWKMLVHDMLVHDMENGLIYSIADDAQRKHSLILKMNELSCGQSFVLIYYFRFSTNYSGYVEFVVQFFFMSFATLLYFPFYLLSDLSSS